ncbi:MAG: PBP1A family penicillin-binding protein [Candidatus Lambdaproteobacteria bacterium]|nr:PBP1A family penicillin-binding protein [Candidatus Lambdaproteobacteria bacterium]
MKSPRPRSRPGSLGHGLVFVSAWLLAALGSLLLGVIAGFYLWAPGVVRHFNAALALSDNNTIIYDKDDNVLATIEGLEDRHYVPVTRIHPYLQKAVVAVEDRRFFAHRGMDPVRLLRAIWVDLRTLDYQQGASTITQQLVKLTLLSSERTLLRKVKEVFMALAVEREYTKLKVLEFYLNRVYLGSGVYGVEKAARAYFHRSAAEVTLGQAALLAALIKKPEGFLEPAEGPAARQPGETLPLDRLQPLMERQLVVLQLVLRQGWITQQEFEAALREPLRVFRPEPERVNAPYFVQQVQRDIRQLLGVPRVSGRGFRVYTTLDRDPQAVAERLLEELRVKKPGHYQAALVALDPATGFVRALVGGVAFGESQFNRATQAERQPGSAFKPILFAAALDAGIAPNEVFVDEPVRYAWGEQGPQPTAPAPPHEAGVPADGAVRTFYEPRNFNDRYGALRTEPWGTVPVERRITLARALELSSNVVAVQLLVRVGIPAVTRVATRLGIGVRQEQGLCIALGCSEVTLLDLTAAYAAFANGGLHVKPVLVRRVLAADGTVLHEQAVQSPEQAISPWTAFRMSHLLQGVIDRGTGRRARLERPAAGKTGTNEGPRDAWFIGFTPELVAGVWMGDDKNRIMPAETGGGTTADLWRDFMAAILPPYRGQSFAEPPGAYVAVRTCVVSGQVATEWCPLATVQFYREAEVPRQGCSVHAAPGALPPEALAGVGPNGMKTPAGGDPDGQVRFYREITEAFASPRPIPVAGAAIAPQVTAPRATGRDLAEPSDGE